MGHNRHLIGPADKHLLLLLVSLINCGYDKRVKPFNENQAKKYVAGSITNICIIIIQYIYTLH